MPNFELFGASGHLLILNPGRWLQCFDFLMLVIMVVTWRNILLDVCLILRYNNFCKARKKFTFQLLKMAGKFNEQQMQFINLLNCFTAVIFSIVGSHFSCFQGLFPCCYKLGFSQKLVLINLFLLNRLPKKSVFKFNIGNKDHCKCFFGFLRPYQIIIDNTC